MDKIIRLEADINMQLSIISHQLKELNSRHDQLKDEKENLRPRTKHLILRQKPLVKHHPTHIKHLKITQQASLLNRQTKTHSIIDQPKIIIHH